MSPLGATALVRLVAGASALVSVAVAGGVFASDILQDTEMLMLRGTVVLSSTVLAGLTVRYFTYMWFGYLHQSEATAVICGEEREWPPVTIIIPAFNEGPVIGAAIQSLLHIDYPVFEILVVNDGSTDDTAGRVAPLVGQHGSVTVRMVSTRNQGKAAALNTGIVLAEHEFVLCMDGDSKLEPQVLRAAIPHFDNPHVGAVAGNVKVVNRHLHLSRFQALEYIEGLNMARRAQAFLRFVNIVPGPIGIFRRRLLVELGGYDIDTFAEDADLTLKILTAGHHIVYESRAVALTEAPESVRDLIAQRYRWARGTLQALIKRREMLVRPASWWMWTSLVIIIAEGIMMPAANLMLTAALTVTVLATAQLNSVIALWCILFGVLDLIAALYCVSGEQEELRLVPYAFVARFFYFQLINVTKLMAALDEWRSVGMTWGSLQRRGRL